NTGSRFGYMDHIPGGKRRLGIWTLHDIDGVAQATLVVPEAVYHIITHLVLIMISSFIKSIISDRIYIIKNVFSYLEREIIITVAGTLCLFFTGNKRDCSK